MVSTSIKSWGEYNTVPSMRSKNLGKEFSGSRLGSISPVSLAYLPTPISATHTCVELHAQQCIWSLSRSFAGSSFLPLLPTCPGAKAAESSEIQVGKSQIELQTYLYISRCKLRKSDQVMEHQHLIRNRPDIH